MNINKHNRFAFTLAEILITLGIIGIVAAMTMPTLVAKHQEKERIVKLKKVYSVMSNAYLLAVNEYGTPDNWDLKATLSPEGADNALNIFAKYLSLSKYCGKASGCWQDKEYKFLDGSSAGNIINVPAGAQLILNDGTFIYMDISNPDCKQVRGNSKQLSNVCAAFGVDINGIKAPNQVGRDYFDFIVSKYGIIPHGTQDDTTYSFKNACNRNNRNTFGCTAWVIFNENMDYLHCDDLDWDTKTKCK